MSPTNEMIECMTCTQLISSNSGQCSHCLLRYCPQCLLRHHYYDVKNEFLEMIEKINTILTKFLYCAHNQTEWTEHLTADQKRLQIYIDLIESADKNFPMTILPHFQWVKHVRSLISKNSFAINENCTSLMYPSVKNSVNNK